MGAKGSNQVTQTQTQAPPKFIRQAQQNVIGQAQEAASAPFAQPAQPVAPFSPFQQQAFGQIQGLQGMTDPYFAAAQAGMTEAGTPITQDDINRYLNPYADAALANMNKYIFGPQRVQTMGQARARAGGAGADRLALTQQNLDYTQADALSQALAGFYSPAIAQAQRAKEMALTSGAGWANLGTGAQNAALQATGALGGAGGQQQAQQQAELMSPYQLELARLAYPFQTTQFLSGITAQQAPGAGGTTTGTTTYPTPSPLNQAIGLGTAAAGAFMGNPMMVSGGLKGASAPYYGQSYNMPIGTGYSMPVFAAGGTVADDTRNWIDIGFNMAKRAVGGDKTNIESAGGAVGPFRMGEGFDFGGPVIDGDYTDETPAPFSDRFAGTEAPAPFADRWQESSLSPAGNVDARFGQGTAGSLNPLPAVRSLMDQGNARFQEMQQGPLVPPELHGRIYGNAPPPPSPEPTETPPGPLQVTVGPHPGTRPTPGPVMPAEDPSIDLRRLMMPREAMPYPDALSRDWGQRAVRSPWLSLVDAGAKIAQTTGPVGSAIASGIQAGTKTLEGQRKALRSEEAINQRASALYQRAKSELDRYTKITPYQKASLEQARFQQMPYTTGEGHPVIMDTKSGDMYDAQTKERVQGGVPLTHTTRGGQGVWENKRQGWLKVHPGDEKGALNYANGRTVMSNAQIANLAFMRAQADRTAYQRTMDGQTASTEELEQYQEKRRQLHLKWYQEHNTMDSSATGAEPGPD